MSGRDEGAKVVNWSNSNKERKEPSRQRISNGGVQKEGRADTSKDWLARLSIRYLAGDSRAWEKECVAIRVVI